VLVPLQVTWAKLGQHQAHGTSLAAIVPLGVAGGLVYYFGGRSPQVDLRLAVLLAAGSVVGAYLGARLMRRIPERELRMIFVALLGVVGLKELLLP